MNLNRKGCKPKFIEELKYVQPIIVGGKLRGVKGLKTPP